MCTNIYGTLRGNQGKISNIGNQIDFVRVEDDSNIVMYYTATRTGLLPRTAPLTILCNTYIDNTNTTLSGNLIMSNPNSKFYGNTSSYTNLNSNVLTNNVYIGYGQSANPVITTTAYSNTIGSNLFVKSNVIIEGNLWCGQNVYAQRYFGDITGTTGRLTLSGATLTTVTVSGPSDTFAARITGNLTVNDKITAVYYTGDIANCITNIKNIGLTDQNNKKIYIPTDTSLVIGASATPASSNVFEVNQPTGTLTSNIFLNTANTYIVGNTYVQGRFSAEDIFVVALSDEYGGLSVSNISSLCSFRTPNRWLLTRNPRFTVETPFVAPIAAVGQVSQTLLEFDIRYNTDNVYTTGSQTSIYTTRPFMFSQSNVLAGGTSNTYNSMSTIQTTIATPANFPARVTGREGTPAIATILPDDTEVGIFLSNAWTYGPLTTFPGGTVLAPSGGTVASTVTASGAKVIFYYRNILG